MTAVLADTLLTIINGNADGILVVDADGFIRFCNTAAEAMFGQPAAVLTGAFFGFPLAEGTTTEIDLLRGGARVTVEMRVGDMTWEGQPAHLASLRDITERKQAQEAITLRNRALEASGSGIMIVEARGTARPIVYANPAMEALTGYIAWELIEQDCRFLWECNPDAHVNAWLDAALVEGRAYSAVIQCERKDSVPYWAEAHLSPIRDDDGQLTHFVGVLHDISDRKILEAEVIERERIGVALEKERELRALKDRLLTMLSHELRTPLALIRLAHDMLRQYGDKASEEERLQYLDSIRAQSEHLTDLISDSMAVSRSERMTQEFAPDILDLITCCRDVVEEFQLSYHRTHDIRFACSVSLIRAPVDRRLLRQALTNLLANAVKYSPAGGVIDFALQANGKHAIISVHDDGIGIAPEDQARVFEPFHRGGNADNIPGTGLGLAIVHEAIKAHGGTITLQSALGQGTTFTITLPMIGMRG